MMQNAIQPTGRAAPKVAHSLLLRPFVEADRSAVLEVFDANVPTFFATEERAWFEDSLSDLDRPAFFVTVGGEAAAFGEYEVWDYYDKVMLYWGMAHPRFHGHGQGLSLWLLAERLALIAEETPPTRWVTVDTSPTIAPFFLRQGFETASVWPQGYRAGGEMHVIRFDLAATTPEALKVRRAAAYAAASAKLGRAALFAHCAALTMFAVYLPCDRKTYALATADALAARVGLDMGAFWAPTAGSYFGRVTKAEIISAVREGVSQDAAQRIAGAKKPEMAKAAEALLAGTGWLPDALRTATEPTSMREPADPQS